MSLPKTRIYAIFTCLFSCLLLASGMAAIPSDIVEQVRGDAAAAQHAVAFSAVGGAGEQHAIINAKVGDAISVTLSTVIGYVPLIVAASAAGVGDLKSMGVPELSASEVRDAITKPPLLPNGLESAAQPVPVPNLKQAGSGAGMIVGAPVPYLAVLKVTSSGNYALLFQVVRPWAPSTEDSSTFVLEVHAAA